MARSLLPALALILAAAPCVALGIGSNKEVPPDATDKQIIQLAQEAFNRSNYKLASHYYNTLLQRYGNNTVDYIIGNYELAHIAARKKDYASAVPRLNEILAIYNDTPAGYLPASYKVLAQMDLDRIPAATRQSITAGSKQNDYYEDGDYGDTDFFGTPPAEESGEEDDYWGNYSGGGYW